MRTSIRRNADEGRLLLLLRSMHSIFSSRERVRDSRSVVGHHHFAGKHAWHGREGRRIHVVTVAWLRADRTVVSLDHRWGTRRTIVVSFIWDMDTLPDERVAVELLVLAFLEAAFL
jgi:hypothetical protein